MAADAVLSSGHSELHAGMILQHGSLALSMDREGWSGSPLLFRGELSDEAGKTNTFHGSARSQRLEIDRLEESANLWKIARGLPAVAPFLPRQLTVERFPLLEVDGIRRKVRGDHAVWSVENIRIKEAGEITVQVKDRDVTVRDQTGQAGFDGTRWNLREVQGKVFGGSVRVDGSLHDGPLRKSRITVGGIRWKDLREWAGHEGHRASRASSIPTTMATWPSGTHRPAEPGGYASRMLR